MLKNLKIQFLLFILFASQAFAEGSLLFHFREGRVNFHAERVPLKEVLKELGSQGVDLVVVSDLEGDRRVTGHYASMPLEDFLIRLFGEQSFLLLHGSHAPKIFIFESGPVGGENSPTAGEREISPFPYFENTSLTMAVLGRPDLASLLEEERRLNALPPPETPEEALERAKARSLLAKKRGMMKQRELYQMTQLSAREKIITGSTVGVLANEIANNSAENSLGTAASNNSANTVLSAIMPTQNLQRLEWQQRFNRRQTSLNQLRLGVMSR